MPTHLNTYSIVIPAYNEAKALPGLIKEIDRLKSPLEVIVVDDGSEKGHLDCLKESRITVIRHPYNIGNGAAIKTGIREATGDMIVFMDGDGQHDPADVVSLIDSIDGGYGMVVGARNPRQHASWGRRWMNGLFNRLASYVTGRSVRDLTSGFRVVPSELARAMLPLLPNGYSWPTTMTLVLLRSGFALHYVPINARPRKFGHSRIRPLKDGLRFFMIILKICTLYSPFRIFLPVSAGMFCLGLFNYAYTYISTGRFTNMSALMLTTAVIIFMMGLISEQISQLNLIRLQDQRLETGLKQHPKQDKPSTDGQD